MGTAPSGDRIRRVMRWLVCVRQLLSTRAACALLVTLCVYDLAHTPMADDLFGKPVRRASAMHCDDFVGRVTESGIEIVAGDRIRGGALPDGHWALGVPRRGGEHAYGWVYGYGPWSQVTRGIRCELSYWQVPELPSGQQIGRARLATNPAVLDAAAEELRSVMRWSGPPPSQGHSCAHTRVLWFGVIRHIIGPLLLIAALWGVKLRIQDAFPRGRNLSLLEQQLCPTCKYDLSALGDGTITCPECGCTWEPLPSDTPPIDAKGPSESPGP